MQANMTMIIGTISVAGGPPQTCTIQGMSVQAEGSPGVPSHPIYNPPYPSHPIELPPGAGGGQPPYPSHPIPPVPTHPIVIPNPPTEPPLVIWGPSDPRPSLPIAWPGYPTWPPTGPSPQPPPDKWYWHYCSTELGWVLVPPGGGGKPQPIPGAPVATPRR